MSPGLVGCAKVDFLLQSANGHFELLEARRPIASVLDDPATSAELSTRLERVKVMRAFAQQELGLPDSGSYQHYVDLGRAHLLYSVSAAPPLSLVSASVVLSRGRLHDLSWFFSAHGGKSGSGIGLRRSRR